MRKAAVYRNGILSGHLIEDDNRNYLFRYDDSYYHADYPAISLTLKKNQQEYSSQYLFPFFYNMLSEGVNRQLQCRHLKLDENDDFGLLLATAEFDTIGAVSIKKIEQ